MFNKIFDINIIPTDWKCAIIKPIPKSSILDPRVPLNYRGISLLSTVYKMFATVLNHRLCTCLETNNIYVDEQNGFRKGRSCLDHIFALTSIIRGRRALKKSTFVAYVDMEKAFDRVDRELLFYKVLSVGIGGKMYRCLQSIYDSCQCAVNVNGYITSMFASHFGVRQGDSLSPTLFNIYINDLVHDLRQVNAGVKLDGRIVQCLLYADDIAILGESENDVQLQLNALYNWCRKWRMNVNVNKSKIVHYRPKCQERTKMNFKFGSNNFEIVKQYKYLGLVLNEFLDYDITADMLAGAGK